MVLSNRHYTIFLIAPITLSLMVSACSTASKTSAPDNIANSDTDDSKRIIDTRSEDGIDKIGISMPTQYLERWTRDGNNLKASFEALGYEVDLRYAGNLIDTQIDAIYEMIEGIYNAFYNSIEEKNKDLCRFSIRINGYE